MIAEIPYKIPRNGEVVGIVAKHLFQSIRCILDPTMINDYNWYVATITTYDMTVDR